MEGGTFGYLLDFDIYCRKKSNQINENGNLGSRPVLDMLSEFFKQVEEDEISKYHVTFDNYFTSPDLLVHLSNKGLRSTGTVQDNRVFTNDIFPEIASSNPKTAKSKELLENPGKKSSRTSINYPKLLLKVLTLLAMIYIVERTMLQ